MSWDYSPELSRPGVSTYVDKREKIIKTVQDCEPIVEHVAAMRGEKASPDMKPLVEIPHNMINAWYQQGYNIQEMPSDELRLFLKIKGLLGSDFRRLQYDLAK